MHQLKYPWITNQIDFGLNLLLIVCFALIPLHTSTIKEECRLALAQVVPPPLVRAKWRVRLLV